MEGAIRKQPPKLWVRRSQKWEDLHGSIVPASARLPFAGLKLIPQPSRDDSVNPSGTHFATDDTWRPAGEGNSERETDRVQGERKRHSRGNLG